ncbi:MAG TPA: hypothetical protein VF177_08390 [Anaerolineae bacterium]
MSVQQLPTHSTAKAGVRLPAPHLLALAGGLALGRLAVYLWPRLPLLAAVAMWMLALAVAMILTALLNYRLRRQSLWGLAILGQLLGAVGTTLIVIASLG